MDWNSIIGGLVGALVSAAGFGGKFWLDRMKAASEVKKSDAEVDRENAEQPVQQLNEIIGELRGRISQLELSHGDCVEQRLKDKAEYAQARAADQRELGRLEGRVDVLIGQLNHFREANAQQAKDVIDASAAIAAETVKATAKIASDVQAAAQAASDSGTKLPPVDREHPLPVAVMSDARS